VGWGTLGDYDKDGKADFTVWSPSTDVLFKYLSTWPCGDCEHEPETQPLPPWENRPEPSVETPVTADFDGDTMMDAGVYRFDPAAQLGYWVAVCSSGGYAILVFGNPSEIPVARDFTGDGRSDLAMWSPNGTWRVTPSVGGCQFGAEISEQWEGYGDIPIPGDYDGDGKADPAVYSSTQLTWTAFLSGSAYSPVTCAGPAAAGDIPVPGDFNGRGRYDLATFRPSTGGWQWWSVVGAECAHSPVVSFVPVGDSTGVLVPGDYDGDGRLDPAVWRPSDGGWYASLSSQGYPGYWKLRTFGLSTDVPVAPNGQPIR
jgi:hypothetical protein